MADEQQQITDAHAVLQAAEELEQNAEQFQQWGHDSASASCRARAYELRQVLHRLIPAIGVQPSFVADADALLRELVVSIEEYEKVECIDEGRVRRKRRDAAFAKARAYTRGMPETDRAAMTSTTAKE
jgi:Tat protein secretion system quality control protein TatD with DNase activity